MPKPNPFDFVSFRGFPTLRTSEELDTMGDKWTGYLDVVLKALTPIHVVGRQEAQPDGESSLHYRQDDLPVVPAASIRGCLRAFLEALTSGWVSQANADYPKAYGGRHIGYRLFEESANNHRRGSRQAPPAVDPQFRPGPTDDGRIDIPSYLFGIVTEKRHKKDAILALKSKVWIEDAYFDEVALVPDKYWIPSIGGDAFMGGPKPSASNWWYFRPDAIWRRNEKYAEFVGSTYRGRKFYYHQDPVKCVELYKPSEGKWRYRAENPFLQVFLQCIERNVQSRPFRIYFDRVPQSLVRLAVLALRPGNMRHKIGYGKAFGYGSIEFEIADARFRDESAVPGMPNSMDARLDTVKRWVGAGWNGKQLRSANLNRIVDSTALDELARVLGWENSQELVFMYPPYEGGAESLQDGFKASVGYAELPGNVRLGINGEVTVPDDHVVARALWNVKRPIHFRFYQESSDGWHIISKRRP